MTAAFHARHEGFFDPTVLEQKRVLLVGAGSVGSEMARLLVRSGVRRFVLLDPDTVTTSNLCRTAYTARDVGALKVDALTRHLRAIRESVEVDARPFGTTALDDDELEALIRGVDIVLATTDCPPTQARLGALSYHLVPALFAGVYAKGCAWHESSNRR